MNLQPEITIINKLKPLSHKLVKKTVNQYQNSVFSCIFNEEELEALAEDLMMEISDKIIKNAVDEKGMYNYFRKSFNYKCQDKYKAHAHTQKRGNINLANKDISEFQVETLAVNCPEIGLKAKNEIKEILSFLEKFDTPKIKYSKLFYFLLEGYSIDEIKKELNVSSSTIERHKIKTLDLVKTYARKQTEEPFYLESTSPSFLYYINHDKFDEIITSSVYKEIIINKKNKTTTFSILLDVTLQKAGKEVKSKKVCLESNTISTNEEYNYFINQNIASYICKYQALIDKTKLELSSITNERN